MDILKSLVYLSLPFTAMWVFALFVKDLATKFGFEFDAMAAIVLLALPSLVGWRMVWVDRHYMKR